MRPDVSLEMSPHSRMKKGAIPVIPGWGSTNQSFISPTTPVVNIPGEGPPGKVAGETFTHLVCPVPVKRSSVFAYPRVGVSI